MIVVTLLPRCIGVLSERHEINDIEKLNPLTLLNIMEKRIGRNACSKVDIYIFKLLTLLLYVEMKARNEIKIFF